MPTAIVSDLHLGTVSGADVVRRAEPLARLIDVARTADRLVVLGDMLELRERPARAVLEDVAPVLRRLGEAAAGKPVVLVPGNHDHQLVAPALERARLDGGSLALAGAREHLPGDLAGRVAELMGPAELTISYPGFWPRDDVFALHGHYVDLHMTVPRVENLVASGFERFAAHLGDRGPVTPDDYEAVLGPLYALSHAVAQNASANPHVRRNNVSRTVWRAANGSGGGRAARTGRLLVGRVAIPGAVAAINAAGFGPFAADISAEQLRRSGLEAIGEVIARLGVDAEHVVFGHTHRAGPLAGEDEWLAPSGARLVNSGSWLYDDIFVEGDGPANPYWPGRVVWLDETGPPRLESAVD